MPVLISIIALLISAPLHAQGAPMTPSLAALAKFVAAHEKSPHRYGPPDQPWADSTWTWQALRILELAGIDAGPSAQTRLEIANWPTGASLQRRATHARLLRRLGLPTPPPPRDAPFLRAMSNVGSLPLSDLEALVELQAKAGRPVDRASVQTVLTLWRGDDGGWRWPATLEETYDLIRKRVRYTKVPRRPKATSTTGATAAAIRCYKLAGLPVPDADRAANWLRARVSAGGNYTQGSHADADEPTGLWSTWHGLRALSDIGATPIRAGKTSRWVRAHRHTSGGFAHGPDEPASLEATWLALECLALTGGKLGEQVAAQMSGRLPLTQDPGGLSLFQAVVEMGPDPGTSVVLARRIGADLLLIKNLQHGEVDLARRAQAVAAGFPGALHLACMREEHLRAWGVPGLGYATHCSDIAFDPAAGIGERSWYRSFTALARDWTRDRDRGALAFSCSHIHRELLAPVYERTGRAGYDGIMGTWAFAPGGDVIREYPWLHRYVGRRTLIGNHDAHGDPFHWLHRGLRARTLFFARTGDLAGFGDAVAHGRVVAVAHGDDGETTLWGLPHWTRRARAASTQWDVGRDASIRRNERGIWLPNPLAFPIDATTARELPELREGHGVVIRAAATLGDDALPHEVTLSVDGRQVALRLVDARNDGPPALWAPLPDLEPGTHRIRIAAFGRRTEQTLGWGAPVRRRTVTRAAVPRAIRFEGAADVPWVKNTSISRGDFQGSVRVVCARADFIVGSGQGGRIRVRWRGGKKLGSLRFWIDGLDPVTVTIDGTAGHVDLPVPRAVAARAAHRVTLRTSLPGWTLPLQPAPSDLEVVSVEWEKTP